MKVEQQNSSAYFVILYSKYFKPTLISISEVRMKKALIGVVLCFALSFWSFVCSADPGPYDTYFSTDPCDVDGADSTITPCQTDSEVNVIDTVNYLLSNAGTITPFLTNTDLDAVAVTTPHSYWLSTGDASLAFISISAGGFNTPGVYEYGNPGSPIFLSTGGTGSVFFGDGSSFNPYPGIVNPFESNPFGIVIDHDGNDQLYSDPTLNADQYDHMLAFDLSAYLDGSSIWIDLDNDTIGDVEVVLSNTYLLAFEDLPLGSQFSTDHDYNDSIYLLSHVIPIPEPATSLLFLGGIAGLVAFRRKQ